jgi:hypothetical protein
MNALDWRMTRGEITMDKITLPNGVTYNGYPGDMSVWYLLNAFDGTFVFNQREMPKLEALVAYREKGFRGDVDFSNTGKVYIDRLA